MSDFLFLFIALGAGFLIGTFFFGSLWWTTKKILGSSHPTLFLVGGFLVRTAVVLVGLWLVSQGRWTNVASFLLGFIAARVVVVRWSKHAPHA